MQNEIDDKQRLENMAPKTIQAQNGTCTASALTAEFSS